MKFESFFVETLGKFEEFIKYFLVVKEESEKVDLNATTVPFESCDGGCVAEEDITCSLVLGLGLLTTEIGLTRVVDRVRTGVVVVVVVVLAVLLVLTGSAYCGITSETISISTFSFQLCVEAY